MTVPGNLSSPLLATAAGDAAAFQISRSLRFSSGDSAYLNRTPSSAGTRTKWSWSGWVKRGKLGAWYVIFSATGTGNDYIAFEPSNRLVVDLNNSTGGRKLTTRVFRDCSAYYHLLVAADYTSSTPNDRIKIYINGVLEDTFDTNTAPALNYTGNFNNNVLHNISGLNATPQDFFDGYLAECIFVDGSAIAASDVGRYDSNNVWQPKQYSGTYGTNGFRLTFADNSSNAALGTDSSGNSNTWTVNNLTATVNAVYSATSSGMSNPGLMFDGDTSTSPSLTADGTAYTMLTGVSIPCSSSLRINANANSFQVSVNGGSYTSAASVNSTYLSLSVPSGNTLTSLTFKDGAGGGYGVRALEVDGTVLVDGDPTTIDSLLDTPSNYSAASGNNGGNYATINPLQTQNYSGGSPVIANGNLEIDTTGTGWSSAVGTIAVSSGKWYWEYTCSNLTGSELIRNGIFKQGGVLDGTGGDQFTSPDVYNYASNAQKWTGSGFTSYGATYTTGDVIGVALDLDAGTLTFYKNGSSQGSAYTGLSGTFSPYFAQSSDPKSLVNFGARPFAHTPPSNHLPLVTTNLADPTIADGSTAFDVITATGTGAERTFTMPGGFGPDLVWSKSRSNSYNHGLFDTVRGGTKRLRSNSTATEDTSAQQVKSFTSDGFVQGTDVPNTSGESGVYWTWDAGANSSKTYTVKVVSDSGNKYRFDDFGTSAVTLDLEEGSTYVFDQSDSSNSGHPLRFSTTSDGTHGSGSEYTTGVTSTGTPGSAGAKTTIVVAASAPTLYYYCTNHSGMGGQANTNSTAGASNFDGSIQSTCRTNQTAGFSIVTFNSGSAGQKTIGHGLGAATEFIISKDRTNTAPWVNYHRSLGTTSDYLIFATDGKLTVSNIWGSTAPSSTVFGFDSGNNSYANADVVAYCFAPVEGFSAFGSYTGNGSADGPFVALSFAPKWVMVKGTSSSTAWRIWDSEREPYNVKNKTLHANDTQTETYYGVDDVDFLSNGFKIRNTGSYQNTNNQTYIYAAFAEHPFKTARAR